MRTRRASGRWTCLLGIVTSFLLVVGTAAPADAQTLQTEYLLGPEDVLEISVWGHPDLSRILPIGPDGKISLPWVGVLNVSGMTVERLTRSLIRAYAAYIINPRVTVSVREYRKIRASVLGQVTRPGTYTLPAGARLLDALAAAGGVTESAALSGAQLVRPGEPATTVDLESLLRGDPAANTALQGGETLVVSEDLVNFVTIIGEVARPGRYRLKRDMRVLDALLQAGGLTERASLSQVRILRPSEGSQLLDLEALLLRQAMIHNVPLGAGDTLFVPEETNNRFFVMGDVNRAGAFPLKGDITVLQAIALAGGPMPRGTATARMVHIVRRNGATERRVAQEVIPTAKVEPLPGGGTLISVRLESLVQTRSGQEARVQAGDVIILPQTGLSTFEVSLNILAGIAVLLK